MPHYSRTEPLSEEEIMELDLQIQTSPDVSEKDKSVKKDLLRRLFFIGNECKKLGVGETFLRDRLVHEAPSILAMGKNWTPVFKRVNVVTELWARKQKYK
jgi:hypothetical protein